MLFEHLDIEQLDEKSMPQLHSSEAPSPRHFQKQEASLFRAKRLSLFVIPYSKAIHLFIINQEEALPCAPPDEERTNDQKAAKLLSFHKFDELNVEALELNITLKVHPLRFLHLKPKHERGDVRLWHFSNFVEKRRHDVGLGNALGRQESVEYFPDNAVT